MMKQESPSPPERIEEFKESRKEGRRFFRLAGILVLIALIGAAFEYRYRSLQQTVETNRMELDELRTERAQLQDRLAGLVDDSGRLQEELNETGRLVVDLLHRALEEPRRQIQASASRVDGFEVVIDEVSASLSSLATGQEELRRHLESVESQWKKSLQSGEHSVERLESSVDNLADEVSAQGSRLDKIQKTSEEMLKQARAFQDAQVRDLQNLQERLAGTLRVNLELESTITRLDRLQEELNRLKMQLGQ